jgi:hypothetical protein
VKRLQEGTNKELSEGAMISILFRGKIASLVHQMSQFTSIGFSLTSKRAVSQFQIAV